MIFYGPADHYGISMSADECGHKYAAQDGTKKRLRSPGFGNDARTLPIYDVGECPDCIKWFTSQSEYMTQDGPVNRTYSTNPENVANTPSEVRWLTGAQDARVAALEMSKFSEKLDAIIRSQG